MIKALLAAAVLGPLSFGNATQAVAGDRAPGANQVAVNYSDLNLASAKGQRVLKRRLTKAAQSVCVGTPSAIPHASRARQRCVEQAVDQAMDTLSERQLARASALQGDRG